MTSSQALITTRFDDQIIVSFILACHSLRIFTVIIRRL